jgi:hypothetical protein
MVSLIHSCGLTDSLSYLHPPPYPSTYARGVKLLDYILVSDDILLSLRSSRILPLYSICVCYVISMPKPYSLLPLIILRHPIARPKAGNSI